MTRVSTHRSPPTRARELGREPRHDLDEARQLGAQPPPVSSGESTSVFASSAIGRPSCRGPSSSATSTATTWRHRWRSAPSLGRRTAVIIIAGILTILDVVPAMRLSPQRASRFRDMTARTLHPCSILGPRRLRSSLQEITDIGGARDPEALAIASFCAIEPAVPLPSSSTQPRLKPRPHLWRSSMNRPAAVRSHALPFAPQVYRSGQ